MSEDVDRLAELETEYQAVSRRASRRVVRNMLVGYAASFALIFAFGERRGIPWSILLITVLVMLVVTLAVLAIWRRVAPDTATPASVVGLTRSKRWYIYRAMWHKRALDQAELVPLVEEMARKMRRGVPIVLITFAYFSGGAAINIAQGDAFMPRWFSIGQLVLFPCLFAQQVLLARRSALVARLSRETLAPDLPETDDDGVGDRDDRGRATRRRWGLIAFGVLMALSLLARAFTGPRHQSAANAMDVSTIVIVAQGSMPDGATWLLDEFRTRGSEICARISLLSLRVQVSRSGRQTVRHGPSSTIRCGWFVPLSWSTVADGQRLVVAGRALAAAATVRLTLCDGRVISADPQRTGTAPEFGDSYFGFGIDGSGFRHIAAVDGVGHEIAYADSKGLVFNGQRVPHTSDHLPACA